MSRSFRMFCIAAVAVTAGILAGSAPAVSSGVVLSIHDIQGAAHISPLNAQSVSTNGIVIAKTTNGFWMQDPAPDANDSTSEGIFVFTSSAPTVNLGDAVTVSGTVSEFRPGGSGSTNLTTTELSSPTISVNSSGNPLPAAITVGSGGRIPPAMVIEDDATATGDVETSGVFDPAADGIDFYESLEGMRAQVNNPVASGPRNTSGEISVLPDDGTGASVRTTRGGIVVRATDFNPERIILDDLLAATPTVNTGDHFSPTQVVGVVDYSFGNFKLETTTSPLAAVSGGLAQESATIAPATQLSVANFNVNNLDPADGAPEFNALAGTIVNNLRSPDIVALEQVQDNNGPTNDSVVDASTTFNTLITAITTAGGPTYAYRQIDPVDDQDGGEPGGNGRVGYLFNPSRVTFVDKAGGTSTNANSVSASGLQFSPGRIDPANTAFNSSRKPLAAEFTFNGQKVFLIANDFNTKGGDQPLFGHFQPPALSSEVQRTQQAQIVNNFVDDIIANVSNPQIVVLGDFNDFEFSNPLNTLKGGVLTDEIETLPQSERYTYVFEGNSQALDHILVNNQVVLRLPTCDVVHVNSEFAVQNSDHDPQLLRYDPTTAPTTALVTSLNAVRSGTSAIVRWRTGTELGLAGFNVYREQAGRRVRQNRQLIAAKGTPAGHRYSWSAGRALRTRYWLQVVRIDGVRFWRGPVSVKSRRS